MESEKPMSETAPATAESLPVHTTSAGKSLTELSENQLLLVVFLRHSGCTFCRQALSDLQKIQPQLAAEGAQIVVVSMSDQAETLEMLKKYGLHHAVAISDPEKKLYQHFHLGAGNFMELLGPSVFLKGMKACIFEGHGVGKPEGDVRQMPGVVIMKNGAVLKQVQHKSAADRPDYLSLVQQAKQA